MARIKFLALLLSGESFHRIFIVPSLALFWKARKATKEAKLIPWQEIWAPLSEAKRHGNLGIAQVFLETLFEQAAFDDHGAWSPTK